MVIKIFPFNFIFYRIIIFLPQMHPGLNIAAVSYNFSFCTHNKGDKLGHAPYMVESLQDIWAKTAKDSTKVWRRQIGTLTYMQNSNQSHQIDSYTAASILHWLTCCRKRVRSSCQLVHLAFIYGKWYAYAGALPVHYLRHKIIFSLFL